MIGTIIVDDDVETLKGLESLIPWEENGFRVLGTASDGQSALALVRRHRPGLLIADITMPAMDGLTLIREAQDICPGIKSIILTCHEEFAFAQEAISLGVLDYLLKITLTPEMLTGSLRRARGAVRREQGPGEALSSFRGKASDNRIFVPSDLLVTLIEGDEKAVERLVRKATLLGIGFHGKAFRTFAFFRDTCHWQPSGTWERRNIPAESILEIISDACGSEKDTNLFALGDRTFLLMRWYHEEPFAITVEIHQRVLLALKRLHERFADSVSCTVSSPVRDIRELRSSLEECRRLRDAYFYQGSGLVVSRKPSWTAGDESLAYGRFSEDLVHLLHRPTGEGIALFVAGLNALGEGELHPPDELRSLLRRLLVDVDTAANKRGFVLEHPLAAADTFAACIRLFDWVLREYERQARATLSRSSREEINKVLTHIHAHLNEAIKCESMASFVNLSCSYFSRLFKKEMGVSFTDYLMRQRIEHARDLLTHTRMSFEEITWAVGLENVSYFHRAFKKLTGMTPRQAR